jgi:hypothetical protein
MSFQKTKTIDDLIKQAELEVLLKRVTVEADRGTIVNPVRCPAKGRVDDYQRDEEGRPACVYNNGNCNYFGRSMFDLNGYTKQIMCNFQEGAK